MGGDEAQSCMAIDRWICSKAAASCVSDQRGRQDVLPAGPGCADCGAFDAAFCQDGVVQGGTQPDFRDRYMGRLRRLEKDRFIGRLAATDKCRETMEKEDGRDAQRANVAALDAAIVAQCARIAQIMDLLRGDAHCG